MNGDKNNLDDLMLLSDPPRDMFGNLLVKKKTLDLKHIEKITLIWRLHFLESAKYMEIKSR